MGVLPRALRAGGTVFVWAPSSPAPPAFPRRFGRGVDALRAYGYQVVVGESCRQAGGASAMPPADLTAEFHDALGSSSVDAVIAAVGGWTVLPLLPHLDWPTIGGARKPVIGYSDISVLCNVITNRSGLVTFHGPMVLSEWGESGGPWSHTVRMLEAVLDPDRFAVMVEAAHTWTEELLWWDRDDDRRRSGRPGTGHRVVRDGEGAGPLWGGSLRALGLLCGTPYWPPPPDDAVIVLEDEAIAPDEWWARLEQLRMTGAFRRAGAVVLGRIGRPQAMASGYADLERSLSSVIPSGIPVLADVDLGHTEPMCTLPLGAIARVSCRDGAGELRLDGPFVAP